MQKKLSIREKSGALLICAVANEVTTNARVWINLIKLDNPFSNGVAYSINQNTSLPNVSNETFKSFDEALKVFNEQAEILKAKSLNFEIKKTEHFKKADKSNNNKILLTHSN